MPTKWRKLIGLFGILAFMVFWMGAAAAVGNVVPKHWLAQLLYYLVAGTAWFAPMVPLVKWMNRGPRP